MKFVLTLALKNLFRYYKRTIITALSIALGIGLFIPTEGMLRWANNMSERNIKNYEMAYLKIGNSKFFEDEEYLPLDETVVGKDKIERVLDDMGLTHTPEVEFSGNLINEISGESYPYIGFAIDPQSHTEVYKLKGSVFKGRFIEQGNQVIISEYTSKLLEIDIGDYAIIEADTKYDLHNADAFQVVGIFETPNPEVNMNNFYIPLDAADVFLEMEGEVNLISIKGDINDNKLAGFADSLENKFHSMGLNDVEVKTWKDLSQSYLAVSQGDKGGTVLILFIIFIIVTVGIANTMLMAVYERTGEIGMMRAMGMGRKEVMSSFIFEAAGIGILGGLLGIIIGAGLNWYLIQYGWDFSTFFQDMSYGYRTSAVFRAEWNPGIMIIGLIFSMVSAAIISIFPAKRALKMSISETLKHVEKFG
ncbi:ABC transporter permease [bacterium]|nr:ABC transporter permease [bacterium]